MGYSFISEYVSIVQWR